jgi:hypothetical protein
MSPTPADQERRDRAAFALMHNSVIKAERMRAAGRSVHDIDAYLHEATAIAEAAKKPEPVDEITALRLGAS